MQTLLLTVFHSVSLTLLSLYISFCYSLFSISLSFFPFSLFPSLILFVSLFLSFSLSLLISLFGEVTLDMIRKVWSFLVTAPCVTPHFFSMISSSSQSRLWYRLETYFLNWNQLFSTFSSSDHPPPPPPPSKKKNPLTMHFFLPSSFWWSLRVELLTFPIIWDRKVKWDQIWERVPLWRSLVGRVEHAVMEKEVHPTIYLTHISNCYMKFVVPCYSTLQIVHTPALDAKSCHAFSHIPDQKYAMCLYKSSPQFDLHKFFVTYLIYSMRWLVTLRNLWTWHSWKLAITSLSDFIGCLLVIFLSVTLTEAWWSVIEFQEND